jgi:hypothetical protein
MKGAPMLPGVNNIQEAIPLFIGALLSDNLIAINNLLDRFPKLIHLKDKKNRNVLMMAIYGKPIHAKTRVTENAQNHNVISYLISFFVVAQGKLDIEHEDDDGLNAYDWAVLSGNEFARSLISKLMESDGME